MIQDPAVGYLERLRVAVDIRLVDDPSAWPALAARASAIAAEVPRAALSADEQLLHAAAHALGGTAGRPDAEDVATLLARPGIAEEDLPFAAVVLAARRDVRPSARRIYATALGRPLRPALEAAVRGAVAQAFPPNHALAIGDVVDAAAARWPDWAWVQAVRALEAGDDERLVALALVAPALAEGLEDRIGARLRATGAWASLLAGAAPDPAARLRLVAGAVAWRGPVSAALGAQAARIASAAPGAAASILIGCGDLAGAARSLPWPSGQLPIAEDSVTATLAQLDRGEAAVQALWRTASDPFAPGRWLVIALFALELADAAALRQAATYLAPYAATAWGRVLLARVHLGAGDPALARRTLGDVAADDPVARLLDARAQVAEGDDPLATLRDLVAAHPGWTEARWRYGAALGQLGRVDEALAVLEAAPAPGDDCAILGAPATARAGALLTAAELRRRRGDLEVAERRVVTALEVAPVSPMALRRACVLAVAMRKPRLAEDTHARLRALVPGSRVVDRLLGGVLELRGDLDGALASYDEAGAWDRALVLRTARGTPAPLPANLELADARSVAALHAVAVAAVGAGDLALAGDALARALERRPGHDGLRDDLVAVRLTQARATVRSADDRGLDRVIRELISARVATRDARVDRAYAAVMVHAVERGLGSDDPAMVARARRELDALVRRLDDPRLPLHRAALAVRDREPDAAARVAACGDGDHARLLGGLLAEDRDDALARLRHAEAASDPRVAGAARLAAQLVDGGDAAVRALAGDRARIPALGAGAVLLAADALAARAGDADLPDRAAIATWLDEVAETIDVDARRVRLAAAGLRVTDGPVDLDDLDLDGLDRADERAFATAIVAIEAKRRRAGGDAAGGRRALGLLATLRGPASHVGLMALASIEDAAEAALAAWREYPGAFGALQTAAAVLLRRAIERELGDRDDDACLEAWEAFIAVAGPILASDDAWRELSSRRGRVLPQELAAARDHFEARIADVLARLGKHHRERGATDATFRLARVETMRTTEVAVARALHTLGRSGHDLDLALPLGPLGLDAHDRRAQVIAALGRLAPRLDDDDRGPLQIAQGVLVGALVDGWLELAAGNLDEAERHARDGLRGAGDDAIRLLAAVWQRRIHDALVSGDTAGAIAHAAAWGATGARTLPDDLARQIIVAFKRYFPGYGLSRTRRALGQIRARHDVLLLRDYEAGLILEHVERKGRSIDPEERFQLLVDACELAPRSTLAQQRLGSAGLELLGAPGPGPARRVLDAVAPITLPGGLLVQAINLARVRLASGEVGPAQGRLLWRDSFGEPQTFDLGDDTLIGRHPDCTLQILDRLIAKEHCRILREGDRFVIHDLRSLNGTFVNGDRVTTRVLEPGDQIRIGAQLLELA